MISKTLCSAKWNDEIVTSSDCDAKLQSYRASHCTLQRSNGSTKRTEIGALNDRGSGCFYVLCFLLLRILYAFYDLVLTNYATSACRREMSNSHRDCAKTTRSDDNPPVDTVSSMACEYMSEYGSLLLSMILTVNESFTFVDDKSRMWIFHIERPDPTRFLLRSWASSEDASATPRHTVQARQVAAVRQNRSGCRHSEDWRPSCTFCNDKSVVFLCPTAHWTVRWHRILVFGKVNISKTYFTDVGSDSGWTKPV